MTECYVYVEPTGSASPAGNDGTGVVSTNATTAAANPYKTLVAALAGAITAGEGNRTSKAGSIHFRCLDGMDSYTGVDNTPSVTVDTGWTTNSSNRILIYGFGSGVHNGDINATGTGAGFTLRRSHSYSGNSAPVFKHTSLDITLTDFRIFANNTGTAADYAISTDSTYGDKIFDRMLIHNNGGSGSRCIGSLASTSAGRNHTVKNTICLTGGVCILTGNYGGFVALNCTFISTGSDQAVYINYYGVGEACTFNGCYAHSASGAAFAGVAGAWDGATREANASSDTTAYHATYDPAGLNSVAYSTSAGAYFTNVTGGSEDFHLKVGSSLIDAATGSAQTVDVVGATRSTPDIGAFEYISATTKKLKLLAHPSAASASSIAGVVFAVPSGGDITGALIGEFTGAAFDADLDGSGASVLKVAVADFGGEALTTADHPVAHIRNASIESGAVVCDVIEE